MSKNILNQSDIVDLLIKNTTISKDEAEKFVKILLSTIEDALLEGDSVKIKGFGMFKLRWVEAQKSIDPKSGNEITIEGYNRVVFLPENEIKELINEPFSYLEPVEIQIKNEESKADKSENEKNENFDSFEDNSQPIKVFEEEAEKIKELLNEINAISAEKIRDDENDQMNVSDKKASERNNIAKETIIQEYENTEDNKNNEREEENLKEIIENDKKNELESNAKNDQTRVIDSNFNSVDDSKVEVSEADSFDIVRDISERMNRQILLNLESTNQKIEPIIEEEINNRNISDEINKKIELSDEEDLDEDYDFVDDEYDRDENEENESVEKEVKSESLLNEENIIQTENTEKVISLEEKNEAASKETEKTEEVNNKKLSDIYFTKEESLKNESERIHSENNPVYDSNEEFDDERKSKKHTALNAFLILVAIALVAWFIYNFFQKKTEIAWKNKRLEMIADSTAQAMKIQQIKESLEKQKTDSLKRDSLNIKYLERQKAIIDSLNQVNLSNKTKKNTSKISNQNLSQSTLEKIYDLPRNYTEILASEKMVNGSKLAQFAKKYYGHSYFWVYIYEANRNVIKNPNNVPVGISIKIPKVDSRLIDPTNKECLNYAIRLQSKYLK